jgi:DNA helicase-2/ATP-dependent DNA helicase PcrA
MTKPTISPAEDASIKALNRVYSCLDAGKSFRLEAGAGAGKTYSLIKALKYLIEKKGTALLRNRQQVACITYTNVATDEINSRTDRHPAIHCSTIHAFCWSLIKSFQPFLRLQIPNLANWPDRLKEVGDIRTRSIEYELGYPKIDEHTVWLHHNDVLTLTVHLLGQAKFRELFVSRYPILFIDEYQDTDQSIAEALKIHFIASDKGPLIGFFGDHWQKIYANGCGSIDDAKLEVIGKEANFRSVPAIVECLNRIRPELPQHVKDPTAKGTVTVFHTNDWSGQRRTTQPWTDDLPSDVAHAHLEAAKRILAAEGWNFSPEKSKILMLTHNVLAAEQGYSNLAKVFSHSESFIKKEDDHIAFLVDVIEPVCIAYSKKQYGEMFASVERRTPTIHTHADKIAWTKDMDGLLALRQTATIGAVLDYLKRTQRPMLPDAVERKENKFAELEKKSPLTLEEQPLFDRLRALRVVSYQELIALARFINDQTPFSTKHGVKGAEFENVLVVFGRGWNLYNFNQFLEWLGTPSKIPADKKDTFERNRNLFYVACSRPKIRLAALFTQKLSTGALATLAEVFGKGSLRSLNVGAGT